MSFRSLRNWLRCTFCRRTYCNARYRVGDRHYYSYLGFVSTGCPKVLEKTFPYYGMSAKEIREMWRKEAKEAEEQKQKNT